MKDIKVAISVKSIYEEFGAILTYGVISVDSHGFYDYYSKQQLACCDGEEVELISMEKDHALLFCELDGIFFKLSLEEFFVGTFH